MLFHRLLSVFACSVKFWKNNSVFTVQESSVFTFLVKVWASQKDWDEELEPLKTFILDKSNKGDLFQTLRDFGFPENVYLTFRNTNDLIQTN